MCTRDPAASIPRTVPAAGRQAVSMALPSVAKIIRCRRTRLQTSNHDHASVARVPMPAPPPDSDELLVRRVAFGSRLRAARDRAGLTQEELAERAGIDRPAYSEIERGLRDARLSTLLRIETALGAELVLLPGRASKE
ncbi:helix-turn-helix domain-containing protein [Streptomyces griseorubiginosus]|uniref:helix-turn-helix domain-containing protein n=1 Tax=Streptomyces griseorubiginosus TaxID=67304 RepID=UPI0036E0AB28